jgi:hypothetical protein
MTSHRLTEHPGGIIGSMQRSALRSRRRDPDVVAGEEFRRALEHAWTVELEVNVQAVGGRRQGPGDNVRGAGGEHGMDDLADVDRLAGPRLADVDVVMTASPVRGTVRR